MQGAAPGLPTQGVGDGEGLTWSGLVQDQNEEWREREGAVILLRLFSGMRWIRAQGGSATHRWRQEVGANLLQKQPCTSERTGWGHHCGWGQGSQCQWTHASAGHHATPWPASPRSFNTTLLSTRSQSGMYTLQSPKTQGLGQGQARDPLHCIL